MSMPGTAVRTKGRVICLSDPAEFKARIENDAFPPVMSYFEPQKRTTSCENFINSQRERLAALVSNASAIGLIGIRVRPDDGHIWDPLSEAKGRLVYCSGTRAAVEFEKWAGEVRSQANDMVLGGYFADSFDELCSVLGLASG